MDGAGDKVGWTIDGLAAAILGGAVGGCLLLLGWPRTAVAAAAAMTIVTLAGLRLVRPEPRHFTLPAFKLAPVLQGEADVLLLSDLAEPEPLLLDDPLEEVPSDSRVVQLFAARPLPTPGELQRRIEAHLASADAPAASGAVLDLEVDAAAALRQSLVELRRSLG
jgi:hypothetical protein